MSKQPSESKSRYASLPYRPGVGVMLLNQENMVFVGKRIDTRGEAWQMPQGGIDEDETPQDAVLREMLEEVGTRNAEVICESSNWFYYDLPDYLVPRLWHGKYRGQKQKWFAMRFLGKDTEININTEAPEFMAWRWVPMDDLPQLIVPFKRKLYNAILEEFRPHIKIMD